MFDMMLDEGTTYFSGQYICMIIDEVTVPDLIPITSKKYKVNMILWGSKGIWVKRYLL